MYTSSVSHQPSSPRLLFRDLINVLISYGQGSSTSKHRSLTKQHLIASLPTSAAPLSQQQAPRHFLTINHLVQHSIHKYLTIPSWFPQRSTPHRSFIIMHFFIISPHPMLTRVQAITQSSASLVPYRYVQYHFLSSKCLVIASSFPPQ